MLLNALAKKVKVIWATEESRVRTAPKIILRWLKILRKLLAKWDQHVCRRLAKAEKTDCVGPLLKKKEFNN